MRTIIEKFDVQFSDLHIRSEDLFDSASYESLFPERQPAKANVSGNTCGEMILRSAGCVEQCFGGLMTRLWDDPFEWTLPEELSSNLKLKEYLGEVEATRKKGIALIKSDDDLYKEIRASDSQITIAELLITTIARAEGYFGQGLAILQVDCQNYNKT